ncbi:hypothetical protein N0M98_01560 [Paenibacillus doosanensis]|uniref:CARDB domain-containing protein n=1 Tax=Paenibacillus doosanensis TaxID=1229154 RepID=UPI00217F2F01|nr:CARDB domain-containing protein [Paenibacillus doosanensis]MCS7458813.1 hypothetical protein [Paenibacillus doosanensis]
MRRLLFIIFIFIIVSLPAHFNPLQASAAEIKHDLGEVYIDPNMIGNDNTPELGKFLSKYKSLDYPDYEVNLLGKITRVELQDSNGNKLQELPNKGGNKYGLSIQGVAYDAIRKEVAIPKGYYDWFRDPNKLVWMYDYDEDMDGEAERHYISTRPNVYDQPPSGDFCKVANGPKDNEVTGKGVVCNVAKDHREGTLWTNTLEVPGLPGTPLVDIKNVDALKFDDNFTFKSNGQGLSKRNILDMKTQTIDPVTLHYRFDYEAIFDVPYDDKVSDSMNGVVLRWDNEWIMNIVGKVYLFNSKMKIVAYTDDSPPPSKPDLEVTSLISKNVCITVGQSIPFEYTIVNNGPSTSSSFKVSIRVDGTEIKNETFSGLGSQQKTGTFNYTFNSEVEKQITVYVDSDNAIAEDDESNNSRTETFQAKPAGGCGSSQPKPPDLKITGDFTIMNPIIYFGDDNLVQPENISVTGGNGCAYVSHEFTFTQGSSRFYPRALSPKDANYWFVYDSGYMTYGGGIGKGTVTVYMIINTTCGSSDPIGPKTFEIKTDPNNKPPTIEIAWYKNGKEVVDPVVVGDLVDLKVKKEEDPDGDETFRTWLFSEGNTDWIKGLPAASGWKEPYNANSYRNITASVEGYHKVCATIKDIRGNEAERPSCAFLEVKGPTPIPVINGATVVKENRPLNPPLDSLASYSPVTGRTIDHARDEWKNSAEWTDGTTSSWDGISSSFAKTGKVTVTLHVFDNTGLKSIAPDYHYITVTPDDPPIIDFQYINTMSRGPQQFKNKSYSPDGDGIEIYKVTGGYDWSNNGICNVNETSYSNGNQEFTFNPSRVGNYCFRVYAKEPEWYGKSAYRDYTVQVINDNPNVEFTVTGTASEPMPVNVAGFRATDLVNWTNTSLDKSYMYNSWSVGPNGELVSSKRSQDSLKGPSYYSLPMGSENMGLNKKTLITDGALIDSNYVYSIGNDEYIAKEYLGSNVNLYLISPNHSPIKLVYFAYDQNSQVYFNDATDEVMIVWTDGPRTATSLYRYEQKWTRWSLATLRSGNTSVSASGDRVVTYGSGPGYKASGKKAEWGDGTRPNLFSRLKFVDDYKEINLTARTISSYTAADKVHPYSTISYDSIPAFPQTQVAASPPPLQYYEESLPDQKLGSTTGNDAHTGVLMDAKGNYYAGQNLNGSFQIYRFDAYTGIPTTVRVVDRGDIVNLTSISEDGNTAGLYWSYYDWGDYMTKSGTVYINLTTGGETGAVATHLEKFDSNSYQNGYGWKNNTLVELSYSTTVTNSSLPIDAKIVSDNQYVTRESGQIYVYNFNPSEGQPDRSNEPFTFGQLVNTSSQQIMNGTILWSMKTHLDHPNMAAGMSFRIQNYQNMYRLESTQSSLRLLKISAGRKTELTRINRSAANDTWIPYKIKLSGSQIKVYENNSLIIDLTDGSFGSGTLGPFSTADSSQFRSITYQWSNADGSFATPGTAIVDTAVSYDVKYDDPEKDPRLDARTQWMYAHVDTTMFLDVGDGKSGLSAYNGKTVQNQILTFDKVGRYKIDYRVPDDPHPDHRIANGDLTFEGYSKYSDWYTQYLIVHRRPISNFTIWQDGSRLVQWTDYSYDPDHCYNSGNCQNQADYPTSHGIYKKKFYYVTPSGSRVDGKLIRPTETGTYIVAMAVADEYNAWSDWYEQTIDICSGCQAAPNHPPSVTLTFPIGSQSNPTPVSLQPTIYWNQSDPDPNTVFELFDLNVKDEWGGCVECVTNKLMGTTAGSWAWTMDNLLTMGRKYQAQVRVSDGEAWSGWSNVGWMATNSPPAAYMSYPYGTQDNPNIVNTRTPILTWTQTDPDAGAIFDYYQIQIANEANNVIIYDSGKVWQHTSSNNGSMQVPIELPTGQKMRVRVMVWDQYDAASNWSPQTWMMINRPPKADFDWTPKPVFEGDTVNLINRSTDPDGDELKFVWQINGPVYYAEPTTVDAVIPGNITDYHPGDYTVTLTATDIHGASDTVTKVVPVGDLNVEGFVRHTDSWNENRQSYNYKKTGDPERPRPYDMFWSGEAFVLAAATNQPAGTVRVHMSYTEMDETLLPSSGNIQWSGQMKRDDFETLPDRSYVFRFTAVWPNGHTENADRIITVNDPWTEFTASVRKE